MEEGKFMCSCGVILSNQSKRDHLISKSHMSNLQNMINEALFKNKVITKKNEFRFFCPCGMSVLKPSKHAHLFTKIHFKNMSLNKNNII